MIRVLLRLEPGGSAAVALVQDWAAGDSEVVLLPAGGFGEVMVGLTPENLLPRLLELREVLYDSGQSLEAVFPDGLKP